MEEKKPLEAKIKYIVDTEKGSEVVEVDLMKLPQSELLDILNSDPQAAELYYRAMGLYTEQ
jgi:hypothetical protein